MLDLGAIIAHATIDDAQYLAKYRNLIRSQEQLARSFGQGAAAADKQDAALNRTAASEKKAADAAAIHARATAEVAGMMDRLAASTPRVQQATLRLAAAEERLVQLTLSGTASMRDLASAEAAVIGATERLAAAQKAATSSIVATSRAASESGSRFGSFLAGSGRMLAELGLIVGAFEAVKKIIDIGKEAASFQKSMVQIQTQAGASKQEIAVFSGALLDMSGEVAQAPDDLATSLYHVYSATKTLGFTAPMMLKAVEIAAKGATASGADLEETTNALTATLVSGQGGVRNMAQAMGALNAIVGVGDMKLSDLNDALGSGILVMGKQFNVTLAQMGAGLAVLGDNNIRGAHAATVLRMAIQDLSKPSAAPGAAEKLHQIGLTVTSLRDDLEKGGLTLALHHLHDAMQRAGISTKQTGGYIEDVFTKRAGVGLAILINNLDQYDEKQHQITFAAHNFGDVWKATTQTASFAWKSFGDAADAEGIRIANKVMPDLMKAGQWLGQELPAAVAVLTGVLGGPLAVAWGTVTTAVGLLGDILGPVLSLLNDFKGPIGDVATVALTMWAAFKFGSAIPMIFTVLRGAVVATGDALVGLAATSTATARRISANGLIASVGWKGVLGPLAAVATGIGVVVSLFHSSNAAAKEASDAAKSYGDVLASGGGLSDLKSAITQNLNDKGVPELIGQLNDAMGNTVVTGPQFVNAILNGGKALTSLNKELWKARNSKTILNPDGTRYVDQASKQFAVASNLLQHLNSQYEGMSDAQKKEIAAFKAFGTVAAPVEKVAQTLQIGTTQLKLYAGMLGIGVTKSGDLADASKGAQADIMQLANAFGAASITGYDFLKAWGAFADSNDSSADRGAFIAATLKAANGDALTMVSTLTAVNVAWHNVADKMASGAKSAKQSISAYAASLINVKDGTIKTKAASGDLIDGLTAVQTAAMQAAQAEYQHNRALGVDGKKAADIAYQTYVQKTRGQLIGEAKQLGLTKDEAKKLADQYFGMPKKVKTLIESEGSSPMLTVLKQIRGLLADLVGKPWKPKIDTAAAAAKAKELHDKFVSAAADITRLRPEMNVITGEAQRNLDALYYTYRQIKDKTITVTAVGAVKSSAGDVAVAGRGPARAGGGGLPQGYATVGERGWELVHTVGGRSTVFDHKTSMAMTGQPDRLPGFASGTPDAQRALAIVLATIAAAVRPGATSIGGQRSLLAGDTYSARVARQQSLTAHRAYDAAKAQSDADAKHLKALQDQANADGKTTKAEQQRIDAAQKTADASSKAADRAQQSWSKAADKADRAAQAATQAAQTLLSTVSDRVGAFGQKVADYRTSVASGISGGTTLTSLYSDTGGDASAMKARAGYLLTQKKQFAADLQRLAKVGYSASEINEVAQLGSASGDALARQLIQLGPSYAKQLNAALDSINNVAGAGASSLAQGFYGQGQANLQAMVAGMEKQFPELRKALTPYVNQLAAMFRFTPVVTNPHYGAAPVRHHGAGGRNLPAGWALAGEYGPEWINVPNHADIYAHGTRPIGADDDRVLAELRALRRDVLSLPRATGAEVAHVGAELYERAGQANAAETMRQWRKGRG